MLYKNNRVKLAIQVLTETVQLVNGQIVFEGKSLNSKMKGKVYTFYFSANKHTLTEMLINKKSLLVEGYLTNTPKVPKHPTDTNTLYIKVEEIEVCQQNQLNLNKFDYTFVLQGIKPSGSDFVELLHTSIISSLSDKELRIVCHNSIFNKAFKNPQVGDIYNIKTFMLADKNGERNSQYRDSVLIQSATLLPPMSSNKIS